MCTNKFVEKMTVVFIYKENEEHTGLSCLCEGYHYIGRETPIQSHDKRISRKHALLVIHKNGAILKAVNPNPTFFKSPLGTTVQILHEHDAVSINCGDRFALVEDGFWFKIKILMDNNVDGGAMNNVSFNAVLGKRSNDEDNMEASKRIKLEPTDATDNCDSPLTVLDESSVENLNVTIPCSSLCTSALNEATRSSCLSPIPETSEDIPDDASDSTLEMEQEPPEIFNHHHNTVSLPTNDSTEGNASFIINSEDIKEEPLDDTAINQSEPIAIIQPGSSNSTIGINTAIIGTDSSNNTTLEIKQEVPETTNGVPSISSIIKSEDIKVENSESTSPGIRIKTETDLKGEPTARIVGCPQPAVDMRHLLATNNPIVNVQVRRDRCWYGGQCYRRNPLHKLHLSHPGDADYDSDTDSNQLPCPYGIYCYRRNLTHRRLYKHFAPPAVRPPGIGPDCDLP